MIYDGEINQTKFMIIYSQAISNVTTKLRFKNERIDEFLNYDISIPLTFLPCPIGYIYILVERE